MLFRSKATKVNISGNKLVEYLGQPRFDQEKAANAIGVMTGLAWTSLGGTTLNIEVARVHQKNRGLKLTGNLGKVMKESAEIAYSYIAGSYAGHFCKHNNQREFFDKSFIHLHVPEGATPKDGPSAGITIASALVSLARNERCKTVYAMTGELTLTGKVLAIGGVREKIIAARRARIKNLIMPEACIGVYGELPDYLKEGMNIKFVKHFKEVFALLFENK